jgi:V/A-type H+-transporting ATPase subunit D
MAIKFQYNKTYLQLLQKQLKIREKALPVLQAKEAALRIEVKKAKDDVKAVEARLAERVRQNETLARLWTEFPAGLISVKTVNIEEKKIAGVKTPTLKDVAFSVKSFSIFNAPSWVPLGLKLLQETAQLQIEIRIAKKKVLLLEFARKKTTQKVNLYEKVQIPEYREVLLKIKRFMEDEDNLAKSSQKILKVRLAEAEAMA